MEVRAQLKSLRTSPRKVRLVASVIRGLSVQDARKQLEVLVKRSSAPMLKLLNSAVANAENNFKMTGSNLFVSEIFVDEGATFKRWMPRAMGRATEILKRTSHVTIVLAQTNTDDATQISTDVDATQINKDVKKKVKAHKQGISVKTAQAVQAGNAKIKAGSEGSKKRFQRRKVI